MNKPIVDSIEDQKFIEIVKSSFSINDVAKKIGFKHTPGGESKKKIKERMQKLGVTLCEKDKVITYHNIPSSYNSTSELGLIGEKYFEYLCAKHAIPCLKPILDIYGYEYMICVGEKYLKIQIKTSEYIKTSNGVIEFSLTRGNPMTNKTKYDNNVDYFFLYCVEKDMALLYKNNGSLFD